MCLHVCVKTHYLCESGCLCEQELMHTPVCVCARGETGVGVATLLHSSVTEHYA